MPYASFVFNHRNRNWILKRNIFIILSEAVRDRKYKSKEHKMKSVTKKEINNALQRRMQKNK